MNDQDDLSALLSNVAPDARPATREKMANSAETRAFLEVGLLLLKDDLLDHRGPDLLNDQDAGTRLFAGLSQARLIEKAAQEDAHEEPPRILTVGMFRDRWRYKSRYTEDLIAYLLRPATRESMVQDMREATRRLPADVSFPDLVRQLTPIVLGSTLEDPLWRLQMIIRVALPKHPRVQAFSTYRYEQWVSVWAALIEEITARYRLELRPGFTWLDVAELFHVVADGARLRARALGSVAELSSGDDVLAGAVLAMIPGLFTNAPAMAPTPNHVVAQL
jgi:hypothetical protein